MAEEPSVDPSFLAGKRILVVEDEFLIALDIERILEAAKAEHISVGRNRDALLALQGDRFDLAILDYKLNGDTSDPVADRLVELGVPFIFLTGTSSAVGCGSASFSADPQQTLRRELADRRLAKSSRARLIRARLRFIQALGARRRSATATSHPLPIC